MTPKHILIVDDSALVTDALKLLFEAHSYRVSVANDVAAAVRQSAAQPVDTLLLDLTLPDGDGLSVLSGIRRCHAPLPRVAIAVTGHDDDATRDRCLAAGCRSVLLKPIHPRDLLAAVRALETDPP